MKRIIALIMVCMMGMFSLAGCGGTESSDGEGSYPTSDNPIVLQLGYDPPTGEITDLTAKEFKKIVEEQTEGAVQFELYPQNQLGSMKQMMDGVLSGTIDMTLNPWNMLTTVMPEFNVMILPFHLGSIDMYWKVVQGDEFRDKINGLVNPKGLVYLGTPNGVPRGFITKKEVRLPNDLKGVKTRVMDGPIYTDMFGAWGATTAVISFAECYTALQQGVIDAIDNDPGMGVLMKFFEVGKYYSPTNHIIHGCPMFINEGVWKKLSPEQQQIMQDAAKEMEKFSHATYEEILSDFVQIGKEEFGVTFVDLSEEDRQVWMDSSQPVYDKYRDVIGAEFYDWYIDYVESLR